ncbi:MULTISPECIES: beta-galactosidase family protein [unclassified Rathayibacter]|uniref:glycoside hydrolase family 35 protein n=1 Tax=unclassified Rathayibacter TaxID=2609250 RepID=UPI000CE8A257|nr:MULTISPECIES: beta-galactosidase family protein [unclassified Rathayibacter]PPI20731.1 beta-galactosidase [Rathayibacter sp. AY1B5]PPI24238.1 beta-galactosidase [Rathayibacter sp. AY1B6]PPI36704.1 beta-galactosidase [Rathayibacter sp. AY1B1]
MTTAPESRFAIGAADFELDGRPHRILSGALHYFRIHPDLWADRIRKARLMGLNTIETYVAWNAHEPRRGEWREDAGLDLGRFLDLIAAEGMHAIVRPGPYICAEWDNGALPAWLFRDPEVGVRRSEPNYLAAVSDYLRRVYAIVEPRQIDAGGPVVLVQIENEYGAYGSDKEYLAELVRVTRDSGITVPLTTIDQPTPQMLADGSLPGLHLTGSFGSRTTERLATLREFQPTGPLMCMEFWCGWFDDWGTQHHTTDADASAQELDTLLAAGGSVNIYMFHGGTNFGLTSGANDKGRYAAITTSYDYDAPLDEGGDPTAKFWAFRDVIARYAPVPEEVPAMRPPAPALTAPLVSGPALLGLGQAFGPAAHLDAMASFDDLGHDDGFVLFTTTLDGSSAPARLVVGEEVRDRAWVLLDGVPVGVLARDHHERALTLPSGRGELAILVENQGRVNYGTRIGEHKGLIGGVRLDGAELIGWAARALALECLHDLAVAAPAFSAGPQLASGSFELDEQADLYVDTLHWGKGLVWVNGFLLGRYWRRGPQRTLIVPAPVTRAGRNRVVVLELEGIAEPEIRLLAGAELGHTEI